MKLVIGDIYCSIDNDNEKYVYYGKNENRHIFKQTPAEWPFTSSELWLLDKQITSYVRRINERT